MLLFNAIVIEVISDEIGTGERERFTALYLKGASIFEHDRLFETLVT